MGAVLFIFGAAAVGFPVIFVLIAILLRTYYSSPRLPFMQEELFILDSEAVH